MSKLEHDKAVGELRSAVSTFDKPWFKSCYEFLDNWDCAEKKCLDLCCGNGEFSILLRDKYNLDVTCGDYVPSQLQRVEENGFQVIDVNIDEEEEEVDSVAGEYAGKFDMVVNLAAIEHVFNSDNLLRFAHTVLKPGGVLLINTPNISFLGYRLFSLMSGNRPFGEGHHIRFWDYRFLRTNLFLNGFEVFQDYRRFYTLPEDVTQRAFRGYRLISKPVACLFYACHVLQHIPFMKGLFTDELTVVCRKENTLPLGFDYLNVKNKIESCHDPETKEQYLHRLRTAYERGWLKEHLFMSKLVETHMAHDK